jgi:hypothetical protein
MSEFSMMTGGVNWMIAYASLLLGMIALGLATYVLLVRKIERGHLKVRKASFVRSFKKKLGLKPR